MKNLIILTDHFLPSTKGGGPIKSISNLAKLLSPYFDVTIITSNRDAGSSKPFDGILVGKVYYLYNCKVIYLSSFNIFTIKKYISASSDSILYVNSFFSSSSRSLFLLSLFINIKIIIAPRGELLPNAIRFKFLKKYIYIKLFKLFIHPRITFHATDLIESNEIMNFFPQNPTFEITNVSFPTSFLPLSISFPIRIVFISRIVRKKNLSFAISVISKLDFPVVFDIYGPIEDSDYFDECISMTHSFSKNVCFNYCGEIDPNLVHDTLRNYHIFLFPTLSENFGHIIFESIQSGVIPIISDQTPWNHLSFNGFKFSHSLSSIDSFVDSLHYLNSLSTSDFYDMSHFLISYARDYVDLPHLTSDYLKLFSYE